MPGEGGKVPVGLALGRGCGSSVAEGGGVAIGKIKVQGVDVKRIPTWWPQFF